MNFRLWRRNIRKVINSSPHKYLFLMLYVLNAPVLSLPPKSLHQNIPSLFSSLSLAYIQLIRRTDCNPACTQLYTSLCRNTNSSTTPRRNKTICKSQIMISLARKIYAVFIQMYCISFFRIKISVLIICILLYRIRQRMQYKSFSLVFTIKV